MCQALAALRLGYLSRELRLRQEDLWAAHPFKAQPDVGPCLSVIDGCLNSLSDRMNGCQRAVVADLLRRIDTRHDGACEFIVGVAFTAFQEAERQPGKCRPVLQEQVTEDDGTKLWQQWQHEDWTAPAESDPFSCWHRQPTGCLV